jgi:hypothetical protein
VPSEWAPRYPKGAAMHFAALSRRTVAQVVSAATLIVALGAFTSGQAVAATPATPSSSAVPAIQIQPDSANGCSGAICIAITGSGLHVSDWSTSVVISKTMCSSASFTANGVLVAVGSSTCGTSGDQLRADWSSPGNFANGTVLCNTWSGVSGKPCETVHS